jgi:hypothetical protein
MLDDKEIDKLCYGRLIYADVLNSSGDDAAGPHWGIMLDSNEAIREHDSYFVVMISSDQTDPFLLPAPDSTGLTGFVQGLMVRLVDLPGIEKVGGCVQGPDMVKVQNLVNMAAAAKRATKGRR